MSKNDCFAYGGVNYCTALQVMNCKRCKFYKPKEQHEQQVMEIEHKRYSKEYRAMVKKVKENCEQWTNYKMEEAKPKSTKTTNKSGRKLYDLRVNKKMSQRQLGNLIGLSHGKICNMELYGVSEKDAELLCKALLLPDDYFKEGE